MNILKKIFAITLFYSINLYAQSPFQTEISAPIEIFKENDRYAGRVTNELVYLANGNDTDFIKSVELTFSWWTLLGQPVEDYLFKWEIVDSPGLNPQGSNFSLSLNRDELLPYPDLLQRFENLRPSNVELELTFHLPQEDSLLSRCDSASLNARCFNELTKSISENPHLMVLKSGEDGISLSPSSPRDWAGFANLNINGLDKGSDFKNAELSKLFSEFDQITITDLRVISYDIPYQEMDSIYEELQRRLNEEVEEDDFWSGNDDKADANDIADSNIDDDFWSGNDTSNEDELANNDPFWNGEKDVSSTEESGFWEGDELAANQLHEVQTRDGKQGVVDSNGHILIPFLFDWVLSYESGIARVLIKANKENRYGSDFGSMGLDGLNAFRTYGISAQIPNQARTIFETCKNQRVNLSIMTYQYEYGLVGSSGSFTIPPEELVEILTFEARLDAGITRPTTLERRQRQDCENQLISIRDELKSAYRSNGYRIIGRDFYRNIGLDGFTNVTGAIVDDTLD